MKKFAAVLAGLMVFAMSFTVMADIPDISGLTDEEFVELYNQMNQALVDRNIRKSAVLHEGTYLVGKDIPSGSYELYCNFAEDNWWADYSIKDANGNEVSEGTVFAESNSMASTKSEATWFITLEDGWTLKVTYDMTLTISTGVVFQ